MITLKRLTRQEFVLNSDLIETLEATPDTVVSLTSGKKLVVLESVDEIMAKVLAYKQLCLSGPRIAQQSSRDGP